jgi:hypothetical protein
MLLMRSPVTQTRLIALLFLLGLPMCGGSATRRAPTLHTVSAAGLDVAARLVAIPGVTVTERGVPRDGARVFDLTIEQPVDHDRPNGQRFAQHLRLTHRSDTAPLVISTLGYWMIAYPQVSDITTAVGGNELLVEYRFFKDSRPSPADWSFLTVTQASADIHAVVAAFRSVYPGSFITAGTSKGGWTALDHRALYPDDVEGTVALAAGRGGAHRQHEQGTPECRKRLDELRRPLLARADEIEAEISTADEGTTYKTVGLDRAYESMVMECPGEFWLHRSINDCLSIPRDDAPAQELAAFVRATCDPSFFSDQSNALYMPYYFQTVYEFSGPPDRNHPWPPPGWAGLIRQPELFLADIIPKSIFPPFRPEAYRRMQQAIRDHGRHIIYLYGSNDSADAQNREDTDKDTYTFVIPNGNHHAFITELPEPQRSRALGVLRRWARVP